MTDKGGDMLERDNNLSLQRLEDFNHFCSAFDIREIIAAADESGRAHGYEKEVYAIAILRAVQNGDFGRDINLIQEAVSALWERGYSSGFNEHSFNVVFQKFFSRW